MFDTIITISGPGKTIDAEVILITQLFKELSYNVTVKDQHPFEGTLEEQQEFLEKISKLKNKSVTIKTEHLPWGG